MKNGRFVLFSIMHLAVFLLSLNAVAVDDGVDRVEKWVVITSLDSLMGPLFLMSNEAILKECKLIQNLESPDPCLRLLFEKYRVELSADEEITAQ